MTWTLLAILVVLIGTIAWAFTWAALTLVRYVLEDDDILEDDYS